MKASPFPVTDRLLRLAAAVWLAVMAGFFWSFSVVVMPGLDQTDPLTALAAMQAINRAVGNAFFAVGFFGAPLVCLLLLGRAIVRRRDLRAWLAAVGGLIYLAGAFGVTVAFNVPLNDDLARLDPVNAANAPLMTHYIEDWLAGNHLRTLTSLLAALVLAASLVSERQHGDRVAHG